MHDPAQDIDAAIDVYRTEVLRWNRQISLVSRRGGADALDELVAQSVAGFMALWKDGAAQLAAAASTAYFDLGSGAGLPGFAWHALLSGRTRCASAVVEPRDKRAWFLERLPSVTGVAAWHVARGRWGEIGIDLPLESPDQVLISLKALHLADPDVLSGLSGARFCGRPLKGGTRIVVARFVPPTARWDRVMAARIGAVPVGATLRQGAVTYRSEGGYVIPTSSPPPPTAALCVSRYTRHD